MTTTIADHLQNLANGDEDSWAHLCELLAEDVLRTAYRLTGDHHLAQDAAQEVFLDLKRSARRFRRPVDADRADAAVRAWVGGIAVKTTLY